jgi:hypothetical protein
LGGRLEAEVRVSAVREGRLVRVLGAGLLRFFGSLSVLRGDRDGASEALELSREPVFAGAFDRRAERRARSTGAGWRIAVSQ